MLVLHVGPLLSPAYNSVNKGVTASVTLEIESHLTPPPPFKINTHHQPPLFTLGGRNIRCNPPNRTVF